jgi:hypothetical protein
MATWKEFINGIIEWQPEGWAELTIPEFLILIFFGMTLSIIFGGWGVLLAGIIGFVGYYWKKHWATDGNMFNWKK